MNFVHIVGRLGKDPEVRFTPSGQKVTTLILASPSRKGTTEETIWWRVTLWGERWDKMVPYLTKGKPLMVGGEMRKPDVYVDKLGKTQVGSIDVTADYINFIPFTKPESSESQPQEKGFSSQPQPAFSPEPQEAVKGAGYEMEESDESLPF